MPLPKNASSPRRKTQLNRVLLADGKANEKVGASAARKDWTFTKKSSATRRRLREPIAESGARELRRRLAITGERLKMRGPAIAALSSRLYGLIFAELAISCGAVELIVAELVRALQCGHAGIVISLAEWAEVLPWRGTKKVSRGTVQNALNEAERLGLIAKEHYCEPTRKHLKNATRPIANPEGKPMIVPGWRLLAALARDSEGPQAFSRRLAHLERKRARIRAIEAKRARLQKGVAERLAARAESVAALEKQNLGSNRQEKREETPEASGAPLRVAFGVAVPATDFPTCKPSTSPLYVVAPVGRADRAAGDLTAEAASPPLLGGEVAAPTSATIAKPVANAPRLALVSVSAVPEGPKRSPESAAQIAERTGLPLDVAALLADTLAKLDDE